MFNTSDGAVALQQPKVKKGLYSREGIFALIFVLVFAFILSMPNEFFPCSRRVVFNDLGVYQYIGILMNEGKFPYVDVFDHKGPLLYLLYSLGVWINQNFGMWIINYIFMSGTIGFSYLAAKKFVNSAWSLVICLIVYSDVLNMTDFVAGTPEFYVGFFVSVGLWILADYYKTGDISNKRLLLFGVVTGCAFWFKHLAVVTVIVICFFIIVDCIIRMNWKNVWRYLILFVAGFAIPSILVCIWLVANNAFGAMINDYFLYNLLYAGNEKKTNLDRANAFMFISTHWNVIVGWIAIGAFLINRTLLSKKREIMVLKLMIHVAVALIVTIILLSIPGQSYHHYIVTLFPVVVILSACSLYDIQSSEIKNIKCVEIVVAVALICVIALPNMLKLKSLCEKFWTPRTDETKILDIINTYAEPDDTIIIDGFYSFGLYGASGHDAASKYAYTFVGFSDEQRAEYQEDIKENNPAVILCKTYCDPYYEFGSEILSNYYLVEITEDKDPYYVYVLKERAECLSDTEKLQYTIDIDSYLTQIDKSDNYTAYFAVKDTQGFVLTEEVTNKLTELGFDNAETLLDGEYHTLLGIIRNGEVEYQLIGDQGYDKYETEIDGHEIHMESKTWQEGNKASILIDGEEYAVNGIGFNIVVFDNNKDEVVDSVAFDTNDTAVPCTR